MVHNDILLVSCHCRENLKWLYDQTLYKYIVYSKTDTASPNYLPRNVGREAEAYLSYIINNYYNLPPTLVFIHGHERAWHQQGTLLECLERLGDLTQYKYKNLWDQQWALIIIDIDHADEIIAKVNPDPKASRSYINPPNNCIWNHPLHKLDCLKQILGPNPPQYIYTCKCAQFIVKRECILNKPLSYWQNLLHVMYSFHPSHNEKEIGITFELLWCYLMTGIIDERNL